MILMRWMFLPFQKLHFIQSARGELQQTIILYNHEQFIFQNTFYKAEVSTSCIFRRIMVIFTNKKVKANSKETVTKVTYATSIPVTILWHSLPYVLYLFSISQHQKRGWSLTFYFIPAQCATIWLKNPLLQTSWLNTINFMLTAVMLISQTFQYEFNFHNTLHDVSIHIKNLKHGSLKLNYISIYISVHISLRCVGPDF